MVVAVLVREADDRRAARREAIVELADGVAEVARVARAVAEAEERDLLPAEVRVRQLAVEPVVDVRACVSVASTARCRWLLTGAHVVGARVPGRRAADDAVRRLQVRRADVGDGRRADARRVADVARDALSVACGRACPRRQMKNSFRTSAKVAWSNAAPRLQCEAFNLHWIAAAHRGKANQAAHDGGATRSIRAFSAEILGSRRRERLRGAKDARYSV